MGSMYMWGAQPLLSSQVAQPPREGDPDSEFLRELVQSFDRLAKPYLTGGDWVPISIRTPNTPASKRPVDLLVAEHKVEYSKLRNRKRVWTGPAVLASAWKRGDSLAVTMVNITRPAGDADCGRAHTKGCPRAHTEYCRAQPPQHPEQPPLWHAATPAFAVRWRSTVDGERGHGVHDPR
jgi:hypothetical protein